MRFICFLILSTTGGMAFAQEPKPQIQYKKITEIELDTVSLDAAVVKPNLAAINESPRPVFNPMIQLRTDFNKEMQDSINEIR